MGIQSGDLDGQTMRSILRYQKKILTLLLIIILCKFIQDSYFDIELHSPIHCQGWEGMCELQHNAIPHEKSTINK